VFLAPAPRAATNQLFIPAKCPTANLWAAAVPRGARWNLSCSDRGVRLAGAVARPAVDDAWCQYRHQFRRSPPIRPADSAFFAPGHVAPRPFADPLLSHTLPLPGRDAGLQSLVMPTGGRQPARRQPRYFMHGGGRPSRPGPNSNLYRQLGVGLG